MKRTKTKLISSITVLIVCFAMLIGSTFAWFTDSASTAVNRIESGTLDVALEMKNNSGNWVSAEGETLNWVKPVGHENESVLWEPGCTYELPELRVVNKGNLALKYKIAITGIEGDAELNNAIVWTINKSGTEIALSSGEYFLLPANVAGDSLTISGTMKTDAGNEYQNLSIDGVGITVYATQYTAEFDSFDNQYDSDSTYPVVAPILNHEDNIPYENNSSEKVIANDLAVSTIPAGTELYANEGEATPIYLYEGGNLQRVLKTTSSTADSVTYDIGYNYISGNESTAIHKFNNVVKNIIDLTPGLIEVKVAHSGNPLTESRSEEDGTFYYDKETGKLYIYSSTYSAYTISYKNEFVLMIDGQGYSLESFRKCISDGITFEGKTIYLLNDLTITNSDLVNCYDCYWRDPISALIPYLGENVTFDGAGKTIYANISDGYIFCSLEGSTIKNLNINYCAVDSSMVYDSFDVILENITTSGSLAWNSGNNAAFVTYPFADLTMKKCVNEAELQTYTGDTSCYNAVFCGYALGTGTFRIEDCVNDGSLICGKAALILANWAYSTRVDFVVENTKNNGIIRSMSDGYYGGSGKYNYCTSDYWDKAYCLSFTFDDGMKYTSSTSIKWYDIDAQGSLIGTGTFEYGPFDETLGLTINEDKTISIIPATKDVDKYVISVGTYYGLENGSCRYYVTEELTGLNSNIKAYGFVSSKWAENNNDAIESTENGYTIYSLEGNTYYLITDLESIDLNPRGPEMISVSAYKDGVLVAAAQLNIQ